MAVDKLKVDDPRVESKTTVINGRTYHYYHGKPANGKPHAATVLLAHGFPDLAFTWRYQVPLFLELGLQVIAPDLVGYGGTNAPEAVEEYAARRTCADLAALVEREAPDERVILGGHDWGGIVPWRMHLWQPQVVRALFSICTPYVAPSPTYAPLDQVVQMLPNFTYQLQFAGPELAAELDARGEEGSRNMIDALHAGFVGDGVFTVKRGVDIARLSQAAPAPDMDEDERAFYGRNFARRGWTGPTNWYRMRKVNFDDEQVFFKDGAQPPKVAFPSLFICPQDDAALPPAMSAGIEKHFDEGQLTRASVPGGHWAMWSHAAEVNAALKPFIEGLLKGDPRANI